MASVLKLLYMLVQGQSGQMAAVHKVLQKGELSVSCSVELYAEEHRIFLRDTGLCCHTCAQLPVFSYILAVGLLTEA